MTNKALLTRGARSNSSSSHHMSVRATHELTCACACACLALLMTMNCKNSSTHDYELVHTSQPSYS